MNKHKLFSDNPKPLKSKNKVFLNWRVLCWKIWFGIRSPFRAIGNSLAQVFTIYRVAALLAVIAVVLWYYYQVDFKTLVPNIITDLVGVVLAVFIIDRMYRLRTNAERKKVLIGKLGSNNNAVATNAALELNAEGWLADGSLQRAFLLSCNLDGNSFTGADFRRTLFSFGSLRDTTWFEADLRGAHLDHTNLSNATLSMPADIPHRYVEADLTGASLCNATLTGAKVRHEQLCRTSSLWKATMPDGQLYDGRYILHDDVGLFLKLARNPNNPLEWAEYYGVTVDQYLEGQKWAKINLSHIKETIPA